MSKIVDFKSIAPAIAALTYQPQMPEHSVDDLLIAFCNNDNVGFGAAPTGWTTIVSTDYGSVGTAVYWRLATSSNETPTITLAASETYTCTVVAVRGVNTANPINASAVSANDPISFPYEGIGLTTTSDNCLILSFISCDGGNGPTCEPGWLNITNSDNGANAGGVAYNVKPAAGVVPAPDWFASRLDGASAVCIAINDSGSLDFNPISIPDAGASKFIDFSYTESGANVFGMTYSGTNVLSTIGTKTVVPVANGSSSDSGINTSHNSLTSTVVQDATGGDVSGFQGALDTSVDISVGLLLTSFLWWSPSDYSDLSSLVDIGGAGMLLSLTSDASNHKAWTVAASNDSTTRSDARQIIVIDPDQATDTTYASAGIFDPTALSTYAPLACALNGPLATWWNALFLYDTPSIIGGTSSNPLNFDDLEFSLTRFLGLYPTLLRSGSAGTFLGRVKFGDPTGDLHLDITSKTFQSKKSASEDISFTDFHVDKDSAKLGWEFDLDSGDSVTLANCTFVAGTSVPFEFSASGTSDALINFIGTSVINCAVLLRSYVVLSGMNFISCGSFTQNNAQLTGFKFTDTTVLNDTLDDLINPTFTSGGTGHAVDLGVIATTQAMAWSGNDTGYTAASSGNETIKVSVSSGATLTINVSAGATTPSVYNIGAGTVIVQSSITLTMTVKDTNGDPVVGAYAYIDDDNQVPFIMNTVTDSQGIATVNYGDGASLGTSWRIRKYGYRKFYQNIDIGAIDINLPVTVTTDPQQT